MWYIIVEAAIKRKYVFCFHIIVYVSTRNEKKANWLCFSLLLKRNEMKRASKVLLTIARRFFLLSHPHLCCANPYLCLLIGYVSYCVVWLPLYQNRWVIFDVSNSCDPWQVNYCVVLLCFVPPHTFFVMISSRDIFNRGSYRKNLTALNEHQPILMV